MCRLIAGLFAVRNAEWVEKKIETVKNVFYDSAEDQHGYTSICGDNQWPGHNKWK